jgi:hypothetical protein
VAAFGGANRLANVRGRRATTQRLARERDLLTASGPRSLDGSRDRRHANPQNVHVLDRQDAYADLPSIEILLRAKVLIRRRQQAEPGGFS